MGAMAKRYIPTNVRRFEWLEYASNAIYVAVLPFRPEILLPDPAVPEETTANLLVTWISVIAFTALILSWVWLAARRRKNWARWALVALMAITLPFFFFAPASYMAKPYGMAFDLFLIAIQTYALYLVFSGDAKAWFQHGPAPLGKEEAAETFG